MPHVAASCHLVNDKLAFAANAKLASAAHATLSWLVPRVGGPCLQRSWRNDRAREVERMSTEVRVPRVKRTRAPGRIKEHRKLKNSRRGPEGCHTRKGMMESRLLVHGTHLVQGGEKESEEGLRE